MCVRCIYIFQSGYEHRCIQCDVAPAVPVHNNPSRMQNGNPNPNPNPNPKPSDRHTSPQPRQTQDNVKLENKEPFHHIFRSIP